MKINIIDFKYNLFYVLIFYIVFYGFFRKLYDSKIYFFIPLLFLIIFIFLYFINDIKFNRKFIMGFILLIYFPVIFFDISIFYNIYLIFVVILNYVLYQFLSITGYVICNNIRKLFNLFKTISNLSIVVALFGLFQFIFHDTLNLPIMFVLTNEHNVIGHSFIGMNIFWITSFFDVTPRMDSFLVFAFYVNLFLYHELNKYKYNLINIFFILPVLFLSGHRTPAILLIFSLLTLYFIKQKIKFRHLIYSVVIIVLLIGISIYFVKDLWFFLMGFYYAIDRLKWAFADFFYSIKAIGLLGYGSGFASQGIQYIPGGEDLKEIIKNSIQFQVYSKEYSSGFAYFEGIESGLAKYIVEFGFLGAFFYILILMFFLFYPSLKLKNTNYIFLSGYIITIFLWSLIVHHQIMGDFVTLILLYFLVGVQWGIYTKFKNRKI